MSEIEFVWNELNCKIDYGLEVEGEAGYSGILDKVNPKIKWYYEIQNDYRGGWYQGEWFAVGRGLDGYYFHQGSFGSCSGCDWLQGISTKEEAEEFLSMMKKIIKIGNTKEEAINYLEKEKNNLWKDAKVEIDKLINFLNEEVDKT
jgi:gamma-glutamyl:cysteine ligase YbdK (ATP-grasp superfamily)